MPNDTKLIRRSSNPTALSTPPHNALARRPESGGVSPDIAKQLDELTSVIIQLETALASRAQRYAVRYEARIDPLAQIASRAAEKEAGNTTAVAKRTPKVSPEADIWKSLATGIITALAKEYVAPHIVLEFICLTKAKGVWGLFYEARQMNTPTIQIPLREAPAEKKRLFMQISEQFVDDFEVQVQKAIADSGVEKGNRALARLKRLE